MFNRIVLVLVLACMLFAPGAQAFFDPPWITPAAPRAGEVVSVNIRDGLCDAIFRARPLIAADEQVVVGLPDTIWFPEDGLRVLGEDALSFLLFPVSHPEFFDAVVADDDGTVREIQVKQRNAQSTWVWGAFKMPGFVLRELHSLWKEPERGDEYIGTLVNAYIARGGRAVGVRASGSFRAAHRAHRVPGGDRDVRRDGIARLEASGRRNG